MIQLVRKYSDYIDTLKEYIKQSKYKTSFFIDELEIPKASFYRKLREKTFTVEEVEKLTIILFPKEAYKEELLQSIEQGRKDIKNGQLISSEDMHKAMREKIMNY